MWLWIVSAFFVVFGLGFIVAPIELARIKTGTAPIGASAIMDIRAAHGGAPSMSRFAGVIVDGSLTLSMIASLIAEVAFVVLSTIGLRQVSRSSQDAG